MVTSKPNKKLSPLSIIVPVYNEGENFPSLYDQIRDKVKSPHRLIVVFDFDEDTTVPVVKKYQKEDDNLILYKNTRGRGALNAILSGFDCVESGAALVTMADLSDDLGMVDIMYEKYLEGADVVVGSRYMKGGRQIGGPLIKRTLSRIAGVSLHWVRRIPTHDVTNNFKLYSKNFLNAIKIESQSGFEIGMELTVKAFRDRRVIIELPTTWRDRTAGESNFKLMKWLPSYLKWYFYAFGPKSSKRR